MKIMLETNISVKHKKLLGLILAVITVLSTSTVYMTVENRNLSSNLEALRTDYSILNSTKVDLEKNYQVLNVSRNELYDRLNDTVALERKYWAVVQENITLLPRDTLAVSIYLDNTDGYMGIDGVDRLELTMVGVYGPDLDRGQVKAATVKQYIGGDEKGERWIGERTVAFGPYQTPIMVRDPISNDTIVRESLTSATFYFENYNYLGYMRPGNWITIKLFYDGAYRMTIRELEFYVVGFVRLTLGEAQEFNSGWIGNRVEVEIRHWKDMT